jgi:hypothetical protein
MLISMPLLTRVALGNRAAAVEDFKLAIQAQPQNKEAQTKLSAAAQAGQEQ